MNNIVDPLIKNTPFSEEEMTNYFYTKVKEDKDLNFDDWARSNKFKLMWVGYDEALQLFKKARSKDVYESDINRRDLTFLKKGWDKYIGAKK